MTATTKAAHTASQLDRKADQLLNIGVRMERLINSLPRGTICNYASLSREFSSAVSQIERAAAEARNG